MLSFRFEYLHRSGQRVHAYKLLAYKAGKLEIKPKDLDDRDNRVSPPTQAQVAVIVSPGNNKESYAGIWEPLVIDQGLGAKLVLCAVKLHHREEETKINGLGLGCTVEMLCSSSFADKSDEDAK
jgi:hypothetical protein